MKRILWLIFCVGACATWAQQPTQKEHPSERKESIEEPRSSTQSNGSQESFEEIMGSFSALAMKFSEEDSHESDLFVYECEYISAEAFSRALEPFLTVNGELSDCEDSDVVVITDESRRIEVLKKIAEKIDRPVKQVLVSASVVEFHVTDGFEKDLSLQYNQFVNMDQLAILPGGAAIAQSSAFAARIMDAIVPSGGNPGNLSGRSSYMYYDPDEQAIFSAFLTFLESDGTAQILSSPSLIIRRGHTGTILSGEDIPITESNVGSGGTSFSVEYKSVGIKLRVTPESIFDDRVVLEVNPEVSNIIRYEESVAGRNPVVAIRNASTRLEMNDGYMVSIGGLLREESIESRQQVPLLGSIPFLGALFRSTSREQIRSQLVIFLTVNIVDPDELSMDTIDASGIPEELERRIQTSREDFSPEKRSISSGIKRVFE